MWSIQSSHCYINHEKYFQIMLNESFSVGFSKLMEQFSYFVWIWVLVHFLFTTHSVVATILRIRNMLIQTLLFFFIQIFRTAGHIKILANKCWDFLLMNLFRRQRRSSGHQEVLGNTHWSCQGYYYQGLLILLLLLLLLFLSYYWVHGAQGQLTRQNSSTSHWLYNRESLLEIVLKLP